MRTCDKGKITITFFKSLSYDVHILLPVKGTLSVYFGKKEGRLLNVPHSHQLHEVRMWPLKLRIERVPNHARRPVDLGRERAIVGSKGSFHHRRTRT